MNVLVLGKRGSRLCSQASWLAGVHGVVAALAELLGQNAEPGGGELVPLRPQLTSYITSRKALDCY